MKKPAAKRGKSPRGAGAPVLKRTVSDLRALAHPLRLRMLELFAERPRTTKQVAELLGQPPTRLYHHVAVLERGGLLVLKETRPNRGVVEKWYEGAGRLTEAGGTKGARTRSAKAARRAVATTILEQAKQELKRARSHTAEPVLLARVVIGASPAQIAVVRKRLYDTVHAIRAELECDERVEASETDDRWAVTLSLTPVWPRRKSSRGNTQR
jgi:DNA-binding transcriptional ArsR family regulator